MGRWWRAVSLSRRHKRPCEGSFWFTLERGEGQIMQIQFTPEQEAQIAEVAASTGTDPEGLVRAATLKMLREDALFRAAVMEGKAYADRGEFIEEEDMDARFEEMLRS
jgi:predicted transcriptional regulator